MINTSTICRRGCGNQEIETLTHTRDVREGDESSPVIAYEMRVWLACGHQKAIIMSQENIEATRRRLVRV